MITNLAQDEVVRIGSRNRGLYLVEQAGYTLGQAKLREAAFAAELGGEFIGEAGQVAEAVSGALRNREVIEEESRISTVTQNDAMRTARVWRRRAAAFGRTLALRGIEVATELREIGGSANSVPQLLGQIEAKIGKLSGLTLTGPAQARRQALLAEAQSIKSSLQGADAAQELKIQQLPQATREFYRNKGLLYLALKQINATARMIYADDPATWALFNLSILYRRTASRTATPTGAAAPAPLR